jgi:glycosyltransferase involved in cell wall biosynthesis
MQLSLVVTVFNEELNIAPLLRSVYAALAGYEYELILVDDGSTDRTVAEVKRWANERVRLLIFYRNSGQTSAMAAGIDAARGRYIVTMDGDLQNDPADIPHMLAKLEAEEWDLVTGCRTNRQDTFWGRRLPSTLANWLIRSCTGLKVRDLGCSLKLFRRDIAVNLGLYGELHRYIPVLAQLQGARIAEVAVRHHPRLFGTSKYGLGRTMRVISDLLLMVFFQKYLQRPMHLFGSLGLLLFACGIFIDVYLLAQKIGGDPIWGRPLLILGVILTLGGIQLITFGIMAELLIRIYYESQSKKTYRIREIFSGKRKDETYAEALH